LSRYRAIVARVAEEEAEAGQAGRRTAASLDMRAAAMVLSEHLRRQLADPARANLPAALYRRLVNRATAGLMHPGAKEDKPEWFDLEGIVKKAGWTRRTRQSPGYGIDGRWPHRVAEPGKIQYLDPNGLLRAYEATLGGRVADDSVVWTICAEVAGHTPTVAPHLQDLIDQAQQEGHPLWLYDNTTKMAPMEEREEQAWLQQLERLTAQGTFKQLSTGSGPGSISDPSACLMIGPLGCVFKGVLDHTDEENAAMADNNVPAMTELAAKRASQMVSKLAASPSLGEAAPGSTLEQLRAREIKSFSKVRPVAQLHALSRGNERLGLAPGGILPSGCRGPPLASILYNAREGSWILRIDLKDYFYLLPLSELGRRLTCLGFRNSKGRLYVYQLQACSMGLSDSPAMGQSVTSLVALIANARGCASATNLGVHPQCDDLIFVGGTQEEAERARDIIVALLAEIMATEATDKRVLGPVGNILGKTFDMPAGTVSMPPDRLFHYLYTLHLNKQGLEHPLPAVRREITPAGLTKLVGCLGWLAENSVSGGAHLSGLYAVTAGKHRVGKCRSGVLRDLTWWASAAAQGRVDSRLLLSEAAGLKVSTLHGDASSTSLAAVTPTRAVWRLLTTAEQGMSSARRELRAFTMSLEVLGEELAGTSVALLSDSVAAVMAINKARLKGKGGQRDMRHLYELLEHHSIRAVAVFCPREDNRAADAGSKCTRKSAVRAWATTHGLALTRHSKWLAAQAAAEEEGHLLARAAAEMGEQ